MQTATNFVVNRILSFLSMEFMSGRRFVVAGGATDMPWEGLGLLANEDGHRNLVPLLQIPSCARPSCEVPHDGNLKLSTCTESQCEQSLMEDYQNNLLPQQL